MSKLEVKNSIAINASAAQIWDVLINPQHTPKYMFGCKTISDWKIGSLLLWQTNFEGKETVFVKGTILEIEPNRKLVYTVIDPFSTMEDIPANYLNVHYLLTQEDEKTTLTVIQDGFENAAEGEKRYQEVYNSGEGWMPIMLQIKEIAESL